MLDTTFLKMFSVSEMELEELGKQHRRFPGTALAVHLSQTALLGKPRRCSTGELKGLLTEHGPVSVPCRGRRIKPFTELKNTLRRL